jgi:hypothetical protein
MDLATIASKMLMEPFVEDVRRHDEFYVTTHCGVEVQEAWGRQVYGACHRSAWYKNRGHSGGEVSPEGAWKMYWGDVIEYAFFKLLSEAGLLIKTQVGFWVPQYYLKGRVDGFVRDPDSWTGQDLIGKGGRMGVVGVEVKSTWSYGAKGTIDVSTGQKPWPKWEHIIQAAIYHWHFRQVANYWQIVYLARDKGTARTHNVVVLDDNRISVNGEIVPFTIDHVLARLTELGHKMRKDEAPARDFEIVYDREKLVKMADAGVLNKTDTGKVRKNHKVVKGDWQCKWCDFARMCWQGVELPFEADLMKLLA